MNRLFHGYGEYKGPIEGRRVGVLLTYISTKEVVGILSRLDLADKKCLLLDESKNDKLVLSLRNLQKVKYSRAALANGYDIINADWLVFTKAGLEKVQEVFG